ncbi:MAG: amino acid ABC transporter permease [Synergistaceae bacterium]|jgi:polar amino acid transport system permease protein|nr:amino acid ABC transporter permease [Synergistaceae bacterium]
MDLSFVVRYGKPLLMGLWVTLYVSFFATIFGIVVGILTGIARTSKIWLLRWVCSLYVQVIRGIPLLVFLLYIYFGIGKIVNLSALTAAILGLGLFSGAYVAEIVRGGIQALPKGQWEAAQCIGLDYWQQMRYIVMPQALRAILPALAGQFITLVKDSSLVSVISIVELTLVAKNIVVRTFQPFEVYTCTALLYLAMTYSLSKLVGLLEKKYAAHRI